MEKVRVCDSCYKTNVPLMLSSNTLKSPKSGVKSRKKSSSPSIGDESIKLCEEELIKAYEERVRKVAEEKETQRRSAIVNFDTNATTLDTTSNVNVVVRFYQINNF